MAWALRVVVMCVFLRTPVSTAFADETVDEIREALRARVVRAGRLHICAQWRTYRAPADQCRDRSSWHRMPPGTDPDYDLQYDIVYPWYAVRVLDVNPSGTAPGVVSDPPGVPVHFSWVDGELCQRFAPPGQVVGFTVVNHRNLGILRGKPLLTPVELEVFDEKRTFLDLFSKAAGVTVREVDGGRVWLEFVHPEWSFYVLRGVFDSARDWVPMMIELHTVAEGQRKAMTWLLETQSVLAIGDSYIIERALVINSNPNVLPDTVVVSTYDVTQAEVDLELTTEDIRLMPPSANVSIVDVVRGFHKTIDQKGRVLTCEALDPEEVKAPSAARNMPSDAERWCGLSARPPRRRLPLVL
jgi:hypothetical protein